jgi:hypothetical protein
MKMATPDNLVLIYKELADWHERQGQPQMRDRFLVLAADTALSAGRRVEADLLLARLLRSNPHHMLRPYGSLADAMASPDVKKYVAELRRNYPPEKAEKEFDAMRAARGAAATAREAGAIPPTAPVVDIDEEFPLAGPGREPLKVYRVQDEGKAPPPRGSAKPAGSRQPGAAPRQAAPRPSPLAVDDRPRDRSRTPAAADGDDIAKGSWLSVSLFVILLAAALALAGWTFLWPFLPPG